MRLARATLVITATALLLIGLALLFWAAFDVFLLVFAGVLAAVLLNGLSDALASRTRLSYRWALALVLLAGTAGIIGVAFWLAPGIAGQVEELKRQLPESIDRLRTQLQNYGWASDLLDSAPSQRELLDRPSDIFERVTGVFSTTLGVLTNMLIVVFLGLFMAVAPSQYRSGLLHLIPMKRRPRAEEVLDAIGSSLWWWLLAKIGSMMVVGILTWLGLWALNIPLALTLALLAAVLTFIPNIGPLLSALPAVLLALMQGPATALWVALLFIAIQTVESYLISPVFQQRAVSLPPALVIAAQILMGILAGVVGLIVATPLLALITVLVKELYIKDVLGDTLPEE